MNCPRCGNLDLIVIGASWKYYRPHCTKCGWMPIKPFGELVTLDAGYRLAALKAQGAEPGWYGPDGERCGEARIAGCQTFVWWKESAFTPDEARLCGFVEVPND